VSQFTDLFLVKVVARKFLQAFYGIRSETTEFTLVCDPFRKRLAITSSQLIRLVARKECEDIVHSTCPEMIVIWDAPKDHPVSKWNKSARIAWGVG
jgi:hypothetical protein